MKSSVSLFLEKNRNIILWLEWFRQNKVLLKVAENTLEFSKEGVAEYLNKNERQLELFLQKNVAAVKAEQTKMCDTSQKKI